MSLSSIAGGFLKLPTLFLKRCQCVLVLNCSFSSSNSSNSSSSNNKKKLLLLGSSSSSTSTSCVGWEWRKKLLIIWVLASIVWSSVWLLPGLGNNGDSCGKKGSELWQHKASIVNQQQHFNVTTYHLHHALASDQESVVCTEKPLIQTSQSNGIAHPLKVLGSELERIEKHHHNCVTTVNVEPKDHCSSVQHENIKHPPYVNDEGSLSGLPEDNLLSIRTDKTSGKDTRSQQYYSQEHCENLLMCWMKLFWCTFVGLLVSWNPFGLFDGWRGYLERELKKQQRRRKYYSRHRGKWRAKLLVAFVLGGILGSIWLFWYITTNAVTTRTDMLTNMCEERARMLQDQFNVSMNHVHALAILVATFHHGKQPSAIDQKIFADFTERTAFERPLTSGVAYALKVKHSEREQFEKEHGWKIKKMGMEDPSHNQDYSPDKLDPAPVQDEYAPVIFSQETVSHIVSIDMMSGKEDRENILRARASGQGVLTSPFPLLKSNHLGVILTFAVYDKKLPDDATPEQRIAATKGYLGASYDIPSLVEKLLHQLSSKEMIVVNVYDTTDISAPINMYGPKVKDTGFLHISKLDFGDPSRRHEMHCRFKHESSTPWTAILSSSGVLVITLLVGHIFHAAIERIAKMEDDYCEMTELKIQAEAADLAKSQFLATVSHEIRTPMNGVLGMLQMLMDTNLNGTQLDFAETAYASGKDLIYLINEVLDQAKIESGKLELEVVNFDLRILLDNVLSLFSGRCHDKSIEMAVYVSNQVPKVISGDSGRFRQIITNLVGNAIKFTEDGHVFITVHLVEEVRNPLEVRDTVLRQQLDLVRNGFDGASSNTLSGLPVVNRRKSWLNFTRLSSDDDAPEPTELLRLLVTVEDTGVGIPEDAQKRIFTPFMQADSSTSRNYGGTGIGLSISRCLVEMMGGEIGFASKRGIGSTFTFTANFTKANNDYSLDNDQHHLLSTSEFRGLHGLVVDGKCLRAEVTRYHLQRLGLSVDVATSVQSACSYVSSACDISAKVRLDMVLVENDSWNEGSALVFRQLLQELKQNGRQKPSGYCPKIFLLTSSSCKKLDELKSFGFVDDILLKPLRLNMIATSFQQAICAGSQKCPVKRKPSNLKSLLAGKQILVVDDNKVNCRVAEGVLKKCGASVVCVDSGSEAVEKLRPPHKFDACFMDLQMPEIDGFEATKQIRDLERKLNEQIERGEASMETFGNVTHWHVPILAMTADVFQATHEKCIQWGMDDYVSKPFEEKQLYSAAVRYFESNRKRDG